MLSLLVAALIGAAPAPVPPSPTVVAAAALLRAADDVDRQAREDTARATIAKLRKELKEPAITAAALAIAAESLASLAPDQESVHVAVLDVLMLLAPVELDASALHQKIRARATGFVQRNPASVRGHDVLATALMQQGDEEGQLRALAACADGCRARFLEAQRVWQRVRCFGPGVPDNLSVRMGQDVLATSVDVAFIEPVPGAPATPVIAAVPAKCLLQLQPVASARVASRTGARGAQTLFLLRGITLVSDVLSLDATRGAIFVPTAMCPRICKSPKPRPLPAGLVVP